MGFLFGRGRKHISKNAVWRITQEGRDKLQDYTGDPESQILMSLESKGTQSAEEISRESGLSQGQVERYALSLAKKKRILPVSIGDDSTEDID